MVRELKNKSYKEQRCWFESASLVRTLLTLVILVCVGCVGRIPMPKHIEAMDVPAVAAAMQKHAQKLQSFTCEIRVTFFGPSGRLKGTVSLAAMRPGQFRYNLMGPHGGVLEAFATNGQTFELSKMSESRFLYGPATPDTLDRLLFFAPLNLDAKGWVELLFGVVSVPDDAAMTYDDKTGYLVLSWEQASKAMRVHVDPKTMQMSRLEVWVDGQLVCDVTIDDRHASGLPAKLVLNAPRDDVQATLKTRDIVLNPTLSEKTFLLSPPRGVKPEYWGPLAQ